jgi:hypothetical protein
MDQPSCTPDLLLPLCSLNQPFLLPYALDLTEICLHMLSPCCKVTTDQKNPPDSTAISEFQLANEWNMCFEGAIYVESRTDRNHNKSENAQQRIPPA